MSAATLSQLCIVKNSNFSVGRMEYVDGALAGVGACVFTNPLDVIKTRLQLQGELKARGQHEIFYKNTFHGLYTVARNDGLLALHKGFIPAAWFQVFLNGIRLGTFGKLESLGLTKNSQGGVSIWKTMLVSAYAGCVGSYVASPFFLIKTHMQSHASKNIAVGYQHYHSGMVSGLRSVYQREGIRGLWRGSVSSLPRIAVGSATQLATFSTAKEFLEDKEILSREKTLWNTFVAGMTAGVVVALFMAPFDVVQIRLYNQGVDSQGRGLLYSSIPDCFYKMWRTEGFLGFYKGLGPCYLRIGPHSLLCLVFWDALNNFFSVDTKPLDIASSIES